VKRRRLGEMNEVLHRRRGRRIGVGRRLAELARGIA
jgi:hypothetical protein